MHYLSFFTIGFFCLFIGLASCGLSTYYTNPRTHNDLFVPFFIGLVTASLGIVFMVLSFLSWGFRTLP